MVGLIILLIAAGFLIGGIPSGLIIARLLSGKDIREHGSRNIGATNAFRVLGALPGVITLLCDALKGCIPLFLLRIISPSLLFSAVLGISLILGHDFSPYLKFKGGKGVATSLGVFMVIGPKAMLISITIWALVFALSRIVSIASLAAGIALPVLLVIAGYPLPVTMAGILASLLLAFKHKGNLQRLCKGEEKRLELKKRAKAI